MEDKKVNNHIYIIKQKLYNSYTLNLIYFEEVAMIKSYNPVIYYKIQNYLNFLQNIKFYSIYQYCQSA